MKENRHQVREAQSPKQTHIFNSIIKMPKVKNTERIFKVAREKQLVIYKESPIIPSVIFQQKL